MKKINFKKIFSFKNIDLFTIGLLNKTFQDISIYLNNKYLVNRNKINICFSNYNKINDNRKKKEILIHIVDFLIINNSSALLLETILGNNYKVIFNRDNPDYLIYDVFGYEHLNKKYNKAIKIALYSENIIPDFNNADYALSQSYINYLDRYFKYPSYIYRLTEHNIKNLDEIRLKIIKFPKRKKFCAAVISNDNSSFRLNFIKKLNEYKIVDMGGRVLNNIGKQVEDKIKFLSSYKFSISMENSNGDGYISEKIIDSFMAGTIPIYYGNYMIDEYINPKSLILINNEKDMNEKIEYIKKIDSDDRLYKKLLKEKVFNDINIVEKIENEKTKFLRHVFEQDKKYAKRIDNYNLNFVV